MLASGGGRASSRQAVRSVARSGDVCASKASTASRRRTGGSGAATAARHSALPAGVVPAQRHAQPRRPERRAVAHLLEHRVHGGVAIRARQVEGHHQRPHRALQGVRERLAPAIGQFGFGIEREQHQGGVAHAPADIAAERAEMPHTERAKLPDGLGQQRRVDADQRVPPHRFEQRAPAPMRRLSASTSSVIGQVSGQCWMLM